jgi:DMSO/TMAO reductase YedYZ molybdopterin-dependent catalytic subunit
VIRESFRWRSRLHGDVAPRRLPLNPITRRQWIVAAAGLPLLSAETKKAETSAFDLSLLYEPTVPNELFFVREHFAAPATTEHRWDISVQALNGSASTIRLEDLLKAPRVVLPAMLECAENPVGGGLVSQANWEGVSLASVLPKADSTIQFVRLWGADGFDRHVPIAKAGHRDTLLAFRMNGHALPSSHGGPLRALVPGWYGTDSVKWLRKIELVESAPPDEYRRSNRSLLTGDVNSERITSVQVKSVFSRPQNGAVLRGRKFILRGAAWAGEELVRAVEISVDDGQSWLPASFAKPQQYSWLLWEREWKIPGPGEYRLTARAIDERGNAQPLVRPSSRMDSFELNSCQQISVIVT